MITMLVEIASAPSTATVDELETLSWEPDELLKGVTRDAVTTKLFALLGNTATREYQRKVMAQFAEGRSTVYMHNGGMQWDRFRYTS